MATFTKVTPTVFVRAINGRKQTADLDRMIPMQASHFSLEELTRVYNRARVDYLIPMPLAPHRLEEHINAYDVVLSDSTVMLDTILSEPVGLGLLGQRGERAWISRFGLVPLVRGQGYARVMLEQLIQTAYHRGAQRIYVEIIQDNRPGFGLTERFGFEPLRDLIVARRPPDLNRIIPIESSICLTEVSGAAALALLENRRDRPGWLNQTDTFAALPPDTIEGLKWEHPDGRAGWVVYENDRYQMKRLMTGVTSGDEATVTAEVLNALHARRPHLDAVVEDMPAGDRRWIGYQAAGYFETFRRVEMVKELKVSG